MMHCFAYVCTAAGSVGASQVGLVSLLETCDAAWLTHISAMGLFLA